MDDKMNAVGYLVGGLTVTFIVMVLMMLIGMTGYAMWDFVFGSTTSA